MAGFSLFKIKNKINQKIEKVMKLIIPIFIIIFCIPLYSQSSFYYFYKGEKAYGKGQFSYSEHFYRKVLDISKKWDKQSLFNIGNALYRQHKYKEASNIYFQLLSFESLTELERADVYHNLGNSYLMLKQYNKSIEAFKQSLMLQPDYYETMYNLSFAIKMLKNQEQKKNRFKSENQEQQNKQKDKGEKKDLNKKTNQYSNDLRRDKNIKEGEQHRQMSKQDIERILKAISDKDKQIIEKLKVKNNKNGNNNTDKDW